MPPLPGRPLRAHWCRRLAAVRARDDLEIVSRRIAKVDAATAIVVIDLLQAPSSWIRPVRQATPLDAREDFVELRFSDQKRVVSDLNFLVGLEEIEAHPIGRIHDPEVVKATRSRQPENVSDKLGARLGVARVHDGVIELNCHPLAVEPDAQGCKSLVWL